jgi:phosphinothricin acetyltransferase
VSLAIRTVVSGDAASIAAIYNFYINTTVVTFEESTVSTKDIQSRIQATLDNDLPYLVAVIDDALVGYAYASKWKGRCAYRYSVEITVYLAPGEHGRGVGSALYAALFSALKAGGFHTVIGGISLPNPASIALHEKFAMHKVAHFKEVGFKFDQWIDVGYWQGLVEDGVGRSENKD